MKKDSQGTEEKIIQAAEKIFIEKGYKRTSTYDIAKEAGCNHALIHYYFRTKEHLFKKVFDEKVNMIMDIIESSITSGDLFSAMKTFIDKYYEFLEQNPKIPRFVINELLSDPDRLKQIKETYYQNESRRKTFANVHHLIEQAVANRQIREISTVDFIMDVISNSIFSFIAVPAYMNLSWGADDQHAFLMHRKEEVYKLLCRGLLPDD